MTKLTFQLRSSVALSLYRFDSFTGLTAENTRIIYPENNHEIAVKLSNTNTYSIQSHIWVDQGLGDANKSQAPFVVSDPMFELQPNQSKNIHIAMLNQSAFTKDCESLFWLNLQETSSEIAIDIEKSHPNMSLNNQLKLIYRPTKLHDFDAKEVSKQLQFSIQRNNAQPIMNVFNPTMHYVSMSQLSIENGKQCTHADVADLMLAPQSTQRYTFALSNKSKMNTKVHFKLIDDQGYHHTFEHLL